MEFQTSVLKLDLREILFDFFHDEKEKKKNWHHARVRLSPLRASNLTLLILFEKKKKNTFASVGKKSKIYKSR